MPTLRLDPFIVSTQGVTAGHFLTAAQGLGDTPDAGSDGGAALHLDPFIVSTQGVTAGHFLTAVQGLGAAPGAVSGGGAALLRRIGDGKVWLLGYRASTRSGRAQPVCSAASPLFATPGRKLLPEVDARHSASHSDSANAARPVAGRRSAARYGVVTATGHAATKPRRAVARATAVGDAVVEATAAAVCAGAACFSDYGVVSARGQRRLPSLVLSAVAVVTRRR